MSNEDDIQAFADGLEAEISEDVKEEETTASEEEPEDEEQPEEPENGDDEAETVEEDPYDGLEDVAEPESPKDPKDPKEPKEDALQALRQRNELLTSLLMQQGGIKPPDEALRDPDSENYNPDEWNRQSIAYERNIQAFQAEQAKQQSVQQEQAMAFVKERDEALRKERPHLFGERGPKIVKAIQTAAIEAGIPEEMVPMLSAGSVGLIDDALRYRSGQKKLAQARTEQKDSQPVSKSTRKPPNRANEASKRLKRDGSVDAFAETLLADIE